MNSKQRVLAALSHQTPDRVPVDFGGTSVTGIHVSCVAALREWYGLEKRPVKVHEPYQMLGWIDEDLKLAMGIDTESVVPRSTMFGFPNDRWKEWRMPDGLEVLISDRFITTKDAKGDILVYPEGDASVPPSGRMPNDGYFFDSIIRQEPVDDEHLRVEDNLEEFTPVAAEDVEYFRREVARAALSGRAVVATFGGTAFGDIALVPAPFLKRPKGIRDIAEWYMSTSNRQDYVHAIFDYQSRIGIANLERIFAATGNAVDAVFVCGTDFGTQTSSFCSTRTFDSLWAPYYRRINDWIHSNTIWKTFKHTCGAVDRFIPSLMRAGFDILNPVQCSATGMSPEHLKSAYGSHLTFWGGGIDTQQVLPFGTPAEVREQVLARCAIFACGGGFIFNSIHNIQARTPVANIVAMLDAVTEFNGSHTV
jgi:hypothetical protein